MKMLIAQCSLYTCSRSMQSIFYILYRIMTPLTFRLVPYKSCFHYAIWSASRQKISHENEGWPSEQLETIPCGLASWYWPAVSGHVKNAKCLNQREKLQSPQNCRPSAPLPLRWWYDLFHHKHINTTFSQCTECAWMTSSVAKGLLKGSVTRVQN